MCDEMIRVGVTTTDLLKVGSYVYWEWCHIDLFI